MGCLGQHALGFAPTFTLDHVFGIRCSIVRDSQLSHQRWQLTPLQYDALQPGRAGGLQAPDPNRTRLAGAPGARRSAPADQNLAPSSRPAPSPRAPGQSMALPARRAGAGTAGGCIAGGENTGLIHSALAPAPLRRPLAAANQAACDAPAAAGPGVTPKTALGVRGGAPGRGGRAMQAPGSFYASAAPGADWRGRSAGRGGRAPGAVARGPPMVPPGVSGAPSLTALATWLMECSLWRSMAWPPHPCVQLTWHLGVSIRSFLLGHCLIREYARGACMPSF